MGMEPQAQSVLGDLWRLSTESRENGFGQSWPALARIEPPEPAEDRSPCGLGRVHPIVHRAGGEKLHPTDQIFLGRGCDWQ